MFFGQCWCFFWRVPGEPADVESEAGKRAGKAGKEAAAVHGGVQGRGGADALGRTCGRFDLRERLGLSSSNLLYRWKREAIRRGAQAAVGLEGRVRELEAELRPSGDESVTS